MLIQVDSFIEFSFWTMSDDDEEVFLVSVLVVAAAEVLMFGLEEFDGRTDAGAAFVVAVVEDDIFGIMVEVSVEVEEDAEVGGC